MVRVAALNLRAYPQHQRIADLAALLAKYSPDVVLLQECKAGWLETVCDVARMTGVYAQDVEPTPAFRGDGCAIAVRKPFEIGRTWRLEPQAFASEFVAPSLSVSPARGSELLPDALAARYSARTVFAEIGHADQRFVAASFHATPGTGEIDGRRVGRWKPVFHGAVASELCTLDLPFLFAIDANEPRRETSDSISFHRNGRAGVPKLEALLGLNPTHRGRDLFREWVRREGLPPAAGEYLALTYTTPGRGGSGRRFDSIWAAPEFDLLSFETHYQEALAAGTDHALTIAELVLNPKRG